MAAAPDPDKTRFCVVVVKAGTSVEVGEINERREIVECHNHCYSYKLYDICPEILAAAAVHPNALERLVKWTNSDRVKDQPVSDSMKCLSTMRPQTLGKNHMELGCAKDPSHGNCPLGVCCLN